MLSKKCLASILSGILISSPMISLSEKVQAAENSFSKEETEKNNHSKQLIENGFYISDKDKEKQTISLDILINQNLNTALKKGLEFILNDENSAFIDDKKKLNQFILENKLLCDYIEKTIKITEDKSLSENSKQFKVFRELIIIKTLMEKDEKIPSTNSFFKFISAMQHAYKTAISRKIADDIISAKRGKIENTMSLQSASGEANISATANLEGVNIGISLDVGSSESSSETSFYTIDSSTKIGVSVGTGLEKYLSASVKDSVGFTHSLILYSLEQFLDSSIKDGKLSTIQLREPEIKKIINSRKEMQENEKKLLSLMQNSIEWYLKASEIIPQNVNIKWPDISSTKSPDKQKTVNLSVSAGAVASCLASVDMDVSADAKQSKIYAHNSYLELIESNCAPSAYGENSETISKFLKQDKIKKYKEIKEFTKSYITEHQDLSDEKKDSMISIIISNLIGDLKIYNNSLSVLADQNAPEEEKEKSRKTKKETEKEWLSSSEIMLLNKGRLEILKTAIAVASYLFELNTTEKNQPLFEKLYNEIEHLAKIQVFSKNSSKQKAEYSTSRKVYSAKVNGKSCIKIPVVGTAALNIGYIENIGDAYFDTNKNILVQMQIPMTGDKALGTHSIRENLKKIITDIAKIKNNPFAETLGEIISLIDSNFEDVLKQLGINIPISVPGYFSVNNYMLLNLYFTNIEKTPSDFTPIPLPGDKLPITLKKDRWALKLIKRIDTTSPNLNLGIDGIGEFNISGKIGKNSSKIGNNTLAFLINKFNVTNNGIEENKSQENALWRNFKTSHSEELSKLFINIAKKSDARYELQCIWNNITKNTLENKEKQKHVYSGLKKFLIACKNFSKNQSSENFEKASCAFDNVLKLNYKFSYLPEFQRVHTIKK